MTFRGPNRRTLIKAGMGAPALMSALSAKAGVTSRHGLAATDLAADVRRYAEAGDKKSGGPGDRWTADWTAERLSLAGYQVERQAFEAPFFEPGVCSLDLDDSRLSIIAQLPVVATPPGGITAPLRLADVAERLDGAIAVVRLPYRRWSTLLDPAAREPIIAAAARGAVAVLAITTGPTGEALALNAAAEKPVVSVPLGIIAPRSAGPIIDAARAGREARLTVEGAFGHRKAENIIGVRPIEGGRWIVVSTPRSGWTSCAGERGPGIAIWLALAAWLPIAYPDHSLLLLNNSGHEFENLGAKRVIEAFGPPPQHTAFWLHLGANVAARDWHELPDRLLPLPSADPYRFLMTSEDLVAAARTIFAGQPGLEAAYPSQAGAAGELREIVAAGYPRHAGIFGAHRQHHAASDGMATIVPDALLAAADGCFRLMTYALSKRT